MLKLCRVTKVKVLFLVLVFVFNFDLFTFSAAILEKGLLSAITFSYSFKFVILKVDHLEPWEKGSRKTAGQVGMCGGVSNA